MAKSIGKFAVNIGANTRGFSKGLGRASMASRSFGKSISGLAVKMAGVAGAFLAARSAVRAVGTQFDEVDKIAKFAKQTGLATESIAAFGHAGALAGVGTEQVNKGVQRMSRQIGEANMGIKTAARGFEMLGLDTQALANMSPEQQFGMIADKIKAIKDPAERAAAAYAIFGRSGQDMIPMLMGGSAAMNEARKEAEALGMTFSAVDAAKVEESNDAWHRVKTAVSGVVRMFTVHLAPVLTNISTKFVEVAKVVVGKIKEWAPAILQYVNVSMALFSLLWESVSSVFSSISGVISGNMGSALDFVVDSLISLEFNIRNFESIATAAFLNVAASAVGFGAEIQHFFTGVLPALLGWFTKNWTGIWHTALDFVLTGFINLGQNIRNLFSAIWEFMKTGEWDVAFVPLTEGFRNMIQELPKIPKREIGPLEAGLRDEAAQIQAKLDTDFAVFRDKRREELLGGDKVEIKKPEFSLPTGIESKDSGGSGDKAAAGGIAALERGSAGAFSAIAKQIRGASAERREQENADANKKTAEATEAIAEHLKDNPNMIGMSIP
tara:strand:- start:230 stop:1888 length:1659 start_codon:yes stop_codon:yes gene_type:complete